MPGTGHKVANPPADNTSASRQRAAAVGVWVAYAIVGTSLLVLASHTHGAARVSLTTVGLLAVGVAIAGVASLALLGLGWGSLAGTFREHPSTGQRIIWLLGGITVGAVVGASAYAVGPAALAFGPFLLFSVLAAVRSRPFQRPSTNRRIIGFAVIAAVVSVCVAMSIFL